jgi:hypothetical protein
MSTVPPFFDDFGARCRQLGICDPKIDDATVSKRILKVCPAGTYTSLYVHTMYHHFSTYPGTEVKRYRLVQFKPTNNETLWNMLCVIFKRTINETVNLGRAVEGLLGSPDPKNRHYAQSAYWQNYTIKLYVRMERAFEWGIDVEQDPATGIAQIAL